MSESHADQTVNHRPFAEVYADAAAMSAATGFPRGSGAVIVPFDTSDIGKAVWQQDDDSIWILTDVAPVWLQIDGVGWLAALTAHEAASDPHTGYQKESEKGAASGYASLDGSGLIPVGQLPALAITDVFPVASQAAMLALTAEKGDVAIRSDNGKSYILSTNSPGTLADWKEITFSGGVPGSHASTHQDGGTDEISVANLSGLLADPQEPLSTSATLGPAFAVLTDAATVVWALANKRINNAVVTLGGNRALSITGVNDGASGLLIVKQDGTGGRTLSLPAGSKVVGAGAGAIVLSTGINAVDILSFYYDGTNYWWTYGLNFT
jgi:hypothetical protein